MGTKEEYMKEKMEGHKGGGNDTRKEKGRNGNKKGNK